MSTINDIAKIAGVSAATVSHVVNKTRYVSPELVTKVEEAIKSVDMPPNFVIRKQNKRKMPQGLQKYIVFAVSDTQNTLKYRLKNRMISKIESMGYPVIEINLSGINKMELYKQIIFDGAVACGMVIFAEDIEKNQIKILDELDMPKVAVGLENKDIACDQVTYSNFQSTYKAILHLIRSGHEQIAMLCGHEFAESNAQCIEGYKRAITENKIKLSERYICKNLNEELKVSAALKELLWGKEAPTALFMTDYKIALSTLKYLGKNAMEYPGDISIVGLNDFEWYSLMNPPLTAIKQNNEEICEKATGLLLKRIQEREEGLETATDFNVMKVPAELVVRASTCGIGRGPFGERAANIDELELTREDIDKCKKNHYTAAISFHYNGKAWMKLHEQGIRSVFEKLNISLIAITDANFNPEFQNKQLESLMVLEPDVLIAVPTDDIKTAQAFKKVSQSHTKLVFSSNVPEGLTHDDYCACVSVNERSHGRLIGQGLGEYMRLNNKKNIGILRHNANFYSTMQRDQAGKQILMEEYPELNIVAEESYTAEEEVYDAVLKMIRRNPEIEGIYTSWEGPAEYAMNALTDMHRQDIAISTADLEYAIALSMAKGSMIKAVSAQCPFEQGRALALCAANALLGKKIPAFVGIEPIYVTAENLMSGWKKVFKEPLPEQIAEVMKDNGNYNQQPEKI